MRRWQVLAVMAWLGAANYVAAQGLPSVDTVLIKKAERRLLLLHEGRTVKSYIISLGNHPKGPKRQKGDGRTPEGHYVIDRRQDKSRFHRALHISYPNEEDRVRARRLHVSPGGDILIHGFPDGWGFLGRLHKLHDWTAGCIAVTNEDIDEIWKLVPDGTPVDIRP